MTASGAEVPGLDEVLDVADETETELLGISAAVGRVERIRIEQEAIADFMETAALAVERGDVSDADVVACFDMLKGASENYAKGELRSLFGEARAEIDSSPDDERERFDEWLDEHLSRVRVIETTDRSKAETVYEWDFNGHPTVETTADSEGVTHFSWSRFRDMVYEAVGEDFRKPDAVEAEEWRGWISPIIDDRKVEVEYIGDRTAAVERLESEITASVGYLEPSDAIERGGVYVTGDVEPDSWGDDATDGVPDATESGESGAESRPPDGSAESSAPGVEAVWVPSERVRSVVDQMSIASVRALQNELEARGHDTDLTTGISKQLRVDGQPRRFWALDPEFAVPKTVREEAHTPAGVESAPGAGAVEPAGVTTTLGSDPDAETDGGATDADGDTE